MTDSFDSVFVPPRLEMRGADPVFLETQNVRVRTGRNIIVLEAAGSDQPTIQDLGKKATGIQIDALLVDADGFTPGDNLTAYGKADVLDVALRERRMGVFRHPTSGNFDVRISNIDISANNTRLGVLDAIIHLIVTQERQTVPRFAQSVTRALQDEAAQFLDAAEIDAIRNYTVPIDAQQLREFSGEVQGITGSLATAPVTVGGGGLRSFERLSGIYDTAERLRGSVVDILNRPARLFQDGRLVFDNLENIESPRDFAQALFRITNGLQGSDSIFGKYARRLGLGRLIRLIGENPIRQLFLSRPSAEKFLLSVNEVVNTEIATVSVEEEEPLRRIQALLLEYEEQEVPSLPSVRLVEERVPQPSLTLSARYYNNLDELDAISAEVLHPMLVSRLEVLV